ncbi:MAG: MBL fold metallo-hydrolase [Elusimicrobia bacterium]|nr:MBL fold metallo-hydrolase [Elusimicrobiota bacterium]
MNIIFLGTNGWYDSKTGNTVSILLDTKKYYVVLDAGNGIHKLDGYLAESKPVYIFLSHFHLDHIEGLHILLKFNFKKGLNICAPKNAKKILNSILKQPFTVPLNKLPYKSSVFEIPRDISKLPFECKTLPLKHSSPVLGFKFKIDNKIISYCTDTGYCANIMKLALGADLLISECSYKSGQKKLDWPHLNPESAALLAEKSEVKKLVLTHFAADRYLTINDRVQAEKSAKKIFKNCLAAKDGMIIKL